MLGNGSTQCNCLKKAIKDLSQESIQSTDSIINIQRDFLSEINLVGKRLLLPNKVSSEPNIYYAANYDDICGPWPLPDHPTFRRYDDDTIEPTLCAWKYITIQDMQYINQHLFDKNAVQSIFGKQGYFYGDLGKISVVFRLFIPEKRLSDNLTFYSKSKELYFNLVWKIFKFMRNDNYSAKGISSVLGLFHLAHRFFLSDFWRSADEIFTFLKKGLNLHILLNLPESDMVFNFFEYDKLLDMFWSFYITKLELMRLVCTPVYNLTFNIKKCSYNGSENMQKNEK